MNILGVHIDDGFILLLVLSVAAILYFLESEKQNSHKGRW